MRSNYWRSPHLSANSSEVAMPTAQRKWRHTNISAELIYLIINFKESRLAIGMLDQIADVRQDQADFARLAHAIVFGKNAAARPSPR